MVGCFVSYATKVRFTGRTFHLRILFRVPLGVSCVTCIYDSTSFAIRGLALCLCVCKMPTSGIYTWEGRLLLATNGIIHPRVVIKQYAIQTPSPVQISINMA